MENPRRCGSFFAPACPQRIFAHHFARSKETALRTAHATALPNPEPSRLLFSKAVPETAHGFDDITGFPELFAQPAHMRVDRAGVDHTFVAPDIVE